MTADPAVELTSPDGQGLVDDLVRLLDLERIELNIFRGRSPEVSMQRVFGGQVAAQALVAAARTVDDDRLVHSLHSYFIRPGDPTHPIIYTVDPVRDGRSFTTRRVAAIQQGVPIFTLSASFQRPQAGIDHQVDMPASPAPETLSSIMESRRGFDSAVPPTHQISWPFDVRYIDPPPWEQRTLGPRAEPTSRIWMKATGRLPDDPLLHVCVLTFASDMTLLDSVLSFHGLSPGIGAIKVASLDHAMWFHRPFRADEWFLYSQESPSASGGRGLATGRIYTRDGRLAASVVQEGMVRVPTA